MIILGLGSNLSSSFGDRFKNINLAIENLEEQGIKILKKSSFYETPSYPNPKKPKFINIVILVETNLTSLELMSVLIFIEKRLERKRNKKNDPRTCDIDIIDFNGQIVDFKYKNLNLSLPHSKLIYRNFVLIPLLEVSKNWIHPNYNKKVSELLLNINNIELSSIKIAQINDIN